MNSRSLLRKVGIPAALVVSVYLSSCSGHAVTVPAPTHVEMHCGSRTFDEGAFRRAIASVKDGFLNTQATHIEIVRRFLDRGGGAIWYWDDETTLAMPIAGARVAPGDGRLHIKGAAVADHAPNNRIYFLQRMGKPGIWNWIDYKSSDNEDICR